MHVACVGKLLLLLMACCHGGALANTCIDDYFQLEESLLNRSANLISLRRAFFPTNRQASVSVQVAYRFVGTNMTLNFRWLDSPVLQLIRSDLLLYLSLFTFNVDTRQADIILDPMCNLTDSLINDDYYSLCSGIEGTGYALLNELTTNVSSIYILQYITT